jgi:hypothetical protein
VTEPADRFGVDGPPRQLPECAFAPIEGIIHPNVTNLAAGAAGERTVQTKCLISRESTAA